MIDDGDNKSDNSKGSGIENMSVDELRKIVENERDNNQKILAESSKIFKHIKDPYKKQVNP